MMPYFTTVFMNIKIQSEITRLSIPSMVVSGVIMMMGAHLSSFITTCTAMERWRSVPIIPLLWRVHQYFFSLDVLQTSFFIVPKTYITRSLHKLQWFGYALATNAKSSSSVPHLGEESHASTYDGYLHTSNQNDIM